MSLGQPEAKIRPFLSFLLIHFLSISLVCFFSPVYYVPFVLFCSFFSLFCHSFGDLSPPENFPFSLLPHLFLPLHSLGPSAGVGACGSLPALLVRTWAFFPRLSLSLSPWFSLSLGGAEEDFTLDHIFSAPPLLGRPALCLFYKSPLT